MSVVWEAILAAKSEMREQHKKEQREKEQRYRDQLDAKADAIVAAHEKNQSEQRHIGILGVSGQGKTTTLGKLIARAGANAPVVEVGENPMGALVSGYRTPFTVHAGDTSKLVDRLASSLCCAEGGGN